MESSGLILRSCGLPIYQCSIGRICDIVNRVCFYVKLYVFTLPAVMHNRLLPAQCFSSIKLLFYLLLCTFFLNHGSVLRWKGRHIHNHQTSHSVISTWGTCYQFTHHQNLWNPHHCRSNKGGNLPLTHLILWVLTLFQPRTFVRHGPPQFLLSCLSRWTLPRRRGMTWWRRLSRLWQRIVKRGWW